MKKIVHVDNIARMIEGCRRKDPQQQKLLYNSYAARMFAVCQRYAADTMEAEDILQTGFIKVFEKISSFKQEGSFDGWLRRIMVNTGIESYRRRRRTPPTQEINSETLSITLNFSETALEVKDLLSFLQKLPDNYRTAFTLHVIEGYSHKEISELLNISEIASRANLCRAREALKKNLIQTYKSERVEMAS